MSIFCNKCGKELSDDAIFCKMCGAKVVKEAENWICSCGYENDSGAIFCSKCGAKHNGKKTTSIESSVPDYAKTKNEYNAEPKCQSVKAKQQNNKFAIILAIVMIVIIGGSAYYLHYQDNLMTQQKKEAEKKESQQKAHEMIDRLPATPYLFLGESETKASALEIPMSNFRKMGDLKYKIPKFCTLVSDGADYIKVKDTTGVIDPSYAISVEYIDAKYSHNSFAEFTGTERKNIGSDFVARYKEKAKEKGITVIKTTHGDGSIENCGTFVTVSCISNHNERSFFDNQFIFLHKNKYYIVTISEPYDNEKTYKHISYYASYAVLFSLVFE